MTGYTTREVAEILGLSVHQVRSYARSDLIDPGRGPRNEYRFSFKDIVVLRAASELLVARVHPRTVKRALHRLRDQLPQGRSLTTVHINTEGDRVVVRDRDTVWEPDSGQVTLDFSVADLATRAAPFAKRVVEEGSHSGPMDAEAWFDLAYDLEAVSLAEAREAYSHALDLDAGHVESLLNLGRLLHEEGQIQDAEGYYRRALDASPRSAVAWYNLGVALEDLGRKGDALEAYESSLRFDPDVASAHYNLARLYEEKGSTAAAIRHLSEYRRLRETG